MRYTQSQNILQPNNLEVFVNKKTKGSKQDSKNLLRSPRHEGEEPYF